MVAPATAEEIGHVADRQLDRDANAVEDQDDLEVPACVKGASAISVRARRKGLKGGSKPTHHCRKKRESACCFQQGRDMAETTVSELEVCEAKRRKA